MFYVYILQLNNNGFYIGSTSDLRRRIKEHNFGKSAYTSKFRPVKLIQYSGFLTQNKAIEFERYLKSGSGIAFRKKHLI